MTTSRSGQWTEPNRRTREAPATVPGCLVQGKPDPLLRDWVLGYVGFPPRTMLPPVSRFIPIGAVLLMLEFGPAPGELLTGDRRVRLPVQPVVGLRDRPALIEPQPAHGLTIMLTPPGAHALFDVPLRELTNTFTGAADLADGRVPLLVERLAGIRDWPARFALVDRTLAHWLARGPMPAPAVIRAWRRLYESGGRMRITDLAAEVGTSPRYLEKRFGEQVGLAPKTVARIIRFEAVCRMMTTAPPGDLARLACASGYSDHAHLDREFREFSGCTPTEFLAKEATVNPQQLR